MTIVLAAILAFLLDLLLADPTWLPHPVVYMGKCIHHLEGFLRRIFPKTVKGELAGGVILALLLPIGSFLFSWGVLRLLGWLHPALRFLLETFWCYQALAVKGMRDESKHVYDTLMQGSLEESQQAVGRIVGRDTRVLTREGVTKAAIETVAENFSDGVVAPMMYMFLGGAPLALCYKAINTMDSMVGYKNEKYLYFGRAAARLDDVANYIPSRFAAFLLIAAARLTGNDSLGAFHIWKRDRRNHASPNSAQTESVMAGALGVQLAGPAWYFGELYEKPTIGDHTRSVAPRDILTANRMLYWGSGLCLVVLSVLRIAAFWPGGIL